MVGWGVRREAWGVAYGVWGRDRGFYMYIVYGVRIHKAMERFINPHISDRSLGHCSMKTTWIVHFSSVTQIPKRLKT